MDKRTHQINSLEELQRAVPLIVKAINADPQFGLRAAANPLLAVEELGYVLSAEVRLQAERRVRFNAEQIARMNDLEQTIYELAGQHFNIEAPQELSHVLFDTLKLPPIQLVAKPVTSAKASPPTAEGSGLTLTPHAVGHAPIPDPLEKRRGTHPVIEPLLEYRQIEASTARLAQPELYERIRKGAVQLPVTRIQIRLKRSRTPQ